MKGKPCPDCGSRFNSERNLKLHRQHACDGATTDDEQTDKPVNESTIETSTSSEEVRTNAEGTLTDHNEGGGYGFAVTADVPEKYTTGNNSTGTVFVHVNDVPGGWMEEGDRFTFDIIQTEDGLKAVDIEVVRRAKNKEDRDGTQKSRRRRFGAQKDDTKYGAGKSRPTQQDIKSFDDERKFR